MKVVSLHMEPCSHDCPNASVCYHIRKEISSGKTEDVLPFDFRENMLLQGYTIHEAFCSSVHLTLLNKYKNYNITVSFERFGTNVSYLRHIFNVVLYPYKDQVQVSVYNKEQALTIPGYRKLFLIKDDESFKYAKTHLNSIPFMHYNIDQSWITKERIVQVLKSFNDLTHTLDSCLWGWIDGGQCPYSTGSYIDITFDGTIRTCPFSRKGIPIKEVYDGTHESLFKTRSQTECAYSKIFNC
jgi:hypothetical protein